MLGKKELCVKDLRCASCMIVATANASSSYPVCGTAFPRFRDYYINGPGNQAEVNNAYAIANAPEETE